MKYIINITQTELFIHEVEAENEKDAIQKTKNLFYGDRSEIITDMLESITEDFKIDNDWKI